MAAHATTHLLVDLAGVLADFDRSPRLRALAQLSALDAADVESRLYGSGFVDAADAGEVDAAGVRAGVRDRLSLAPRVSDDALDAAWMSAFTVEDRAQSVLGLLDRVRPPAVVALLSSNDALVAELLAAHLPQVAARADAAFFSGVTGVRKPDPAAFVDALRTLHCAAADALFLDDSTGHVDAAREVGVPALQVTLSQTSIAELEAELGRRGLLGRAQS